MADLLKTMTSAARRARRRPLSTVLALPRLLVPSTPKPKRKRRASASPTARRKQSTVPPRPAPGSFLSDTFTCPQGTLDYRLYTPKGSARRRMPLVVMLHGSSQSAPDFAAGTDMNRLADELGFLVLYPQQSSKVNVGRCWNWHDPKNQPGAGASPPSSRP